MLNAEISQIGECIGPLFCAEPAPRWQGTFSRLDSLFRFTSTEARNIGDRLAIVRTFDGIDRIADPTAINIALLAKETTIFQAKRSLIHFRKRQHS